MAQTNVQSGLQCCSEKEFNLRIVFHHSHARERGRVRERGDKVVVMVRVREGNESIFETKY